MQLDMSYPSLFYHCLLTHANIPAQHPCAQVAVGKEYFVQLLALSFRCSITAILIHRWGRGALLTRGVCNIGKLDYYLGSKGANLGRNTLYPSLSFCEYPEATCASQETEELRWTVAMFEWAERYLFLVLIS